MHDVAGYANDDANTVRTLPRNDDATRSHDANASAAYGNDPSTDADACTVGPRWPRKQRIF